MTDRSNTAGTQPVQSTQELHGGRERFDAVVRGLAQLGDNHAALHGASPAEFDDVLTTRRFNRVRKLLGKLPQPGKSRSHARRLR